MKLHGWMPRKGSVATRQHSPHGLAAKIEIRRRLLMAMPRPRVLECFAGEGDLWREVWQEAGGHYVGCDLKWQRQSARLAYACDCRRLLRCLNLQDFDVFDLDPWGSPWECVCIIAARRGVLSPGERVAFAMTDGASLSARQSRLAKGLPSLTGIATEAISGAPYDLIIDRAVAGLATAMGAEVEARWQGKQRVGAMMRYLAVVLRGITPPKEDAATPSP